MSKLYDNVNNPLCVKGCDVNRTPIPDGDYYRFTFYVTEGRHGPEKDTSELISWLNNTPIKEFFIIDFEQSWAIYLHEDDATLWKLRWG